MSIDAFRIFGMTGGSTNCSRTTCWRGRPWGGGGGDCGDAGWWYVECAERRTPPTVFFLVSYFRYPVLLKELMNENERLNLPQIECSAFLRLLVRKKTTAESTQQLLLGSRREGETPHDTRLPVLRTN